MLSSVQSLSSIKRDCLPAVWSETLLYFIPKKKCILLKTNFHAFDALLCCFLFVLLVFHKSLETKNRYFTLKIESGICGSFADLI